MPTMQMEMRLGAAAVRSLHDATELVALLKQRPDLCRRPAAEVAQVLEWSDRRLRAAAEASNGAVLSAPGCIGYRLASQTAVQDYYLVERARYQSQIREMQARLVAMDRAVHGSSKSYEVANG